MGALALLCARLPAGAALSPLAAAEALQLPALAIDFSVQPSVMIAPGEITMTFVIRNQSDRPVQNIALSSADGLLSEPIGQLGPGESQTLVRPHTVTQDELDAGAITYTVSHDSPDPGGEKVIRELSAAVVKGEPLPGVSFTRQLSSDCVPAGGMVTVIYKIANTGNVALSALRIRDTLGDFTGRLEQLGVDGSKTFISRVALSEAAESAPSLEYTTPSGDSLTVELEPSPIRIAGGTLEMSFSVGQSVFERDTADAILILTNTGNVDYTGITVLDDVYGGIIADAVVLPSGARPVEIAHTYPLRGAGEYRWRITGVSGAGETLDMRTDTLSVEGAQEEPAVVASLEAVARTPRINRPGRVTFDLSIENDGTVMARDALLYEVNRGEIRRLAVIPPGRSTVCSAGYDVASDSKFIFCLNYTDAEGHQRTVTSAPIDVQIAPDGASPEPADGQGGALKGGSVKLGGNSSTFIVLLVIAGAALTVMLTILAVTSLRARHDRLKRVAAEKQRVKAEMGRTGAVPIVKGPPARARAGAPRRKRAESRRRGSGSAK